jgi:hypothetical protein
MRCPNCFNELPVDVTSCPSCTFLLPAHFQSVESNVLSDLAAFAGTRSVGESESRLQCEKEPIEEGHHEHEGVPAAGVKERDTWGIKRASQTGANSTNGASKPQARPGSRTGPVPGRPVRPGAKTRARTKGKGKVKAEAAKPPSKSAAIVRIVVAVVLFCGAGTYIFLFTDIIHGKVPAKAALSTLSTFRNLPSNRSGLTVDQLADQALADSRKSGRLARYVGWVTRPIKGERSKLLVIYSFEEKNNLEHNAQWEVDISNNMVVAQTDFAKALYSASTIAQPDQK